MYKFAIIIEQAPDGGFGAYVPDLPGCVGMGATRNETMENMIEAIRFHIEGMIEEGLGNSKEAKKLLEQALKLNPAFDLLQAENARKALQELK